MKKNILIVIIITSCFALVAGTNNKTYGNDEASTSTKMDYDTTKETYIDKNIEISYPQIVNMSDKIREKKINDLIKDSAYGYLDNYTEEDKERFDLKIDYFITLKSNHLLSIQFFGYSYDEGANHPNDTFYSANIDINNETLIKIEDIINIDEKFVLKFRNGNLISPSKQQKEVLLSPPFDSSDKEWINIFNNADTKESQVYSYLTGDAIGISVPVAHVFGDHAEFEIKYEDLKENIKVQNEIWNDFIE